MLFAVINKSTSVTHFRRSVSTRLKIYCAGSVSSDRKMSYNLEFKTLPKNPDWAENFDVYMCNGFSLPSFAIKFLKNEAVSYEARTDDVYIVSYPKTGKTNCVCVYCLIRLLVKIVNFLILFSRSTISILVL